MKKLALSLVVAGIVANFAFAEGAFVGVEGDFVNINVTDKYTDEQKIREIFSGYEDKILGIKGGYDFDKFRVYGQLNRHFGFGSGFLKNFNKSFENSYIKASTYEFLVGGDYFFDVSKNFRVFTGAYTGMEMMSFYFKKPDDDMIISGDKYMKDFTATEFLLGGKVGVEFIITEHSSIELGAKVDTTISAIKINKPENFNESFEYTQNFTKYSSFVAYSYKF